MIILIDAGHGQNTEQNGKFSPLLDDTINIGSEFTNKGRFREWKYNRVIASQIVNILKEMKYDARLVTPEDADVSLSERIRRINTICNKEGASNVLLISVHANAVGDGSQWMKAYGWEAYTTRGKTKSDILADCLYKRADANVKGRKIREDWTDGDRDKEADFYIIKRAYCPAVLTENFFYDNKDDLKYMTSEEGIQGVVRLHVEGIIDYIEGQKK
jgi:N-acetylmuramoyl-L-alanine amidase